FHKYAYAYIHADTTPFYINAVYDYYKMTGDRQFVADSWKSLTKAYDWCLSTDANGDGLMDNSKAGLGALEFGSLIGVESDVYLSAIWVRATQAIGQLAKAVGDAAYEKKAAENFGKASKAYESKFWNADKKYYSYAFNSKGEQVSELTPWMSVGLAWNIGEPAHADEAVKQLASSALTTDWGVRSISDESKYYDPLNYNYGTVWPFMTSWASAAEFEHRFSIPGYEMLMASVRHTFDNEPGDVTEVFSGASNVWLGEAVPHQGFSTSGVVLPLVRGLFGLDGDAVSKTVTFAPQFPADWQSASASNYRVGNAEFSFAYSKTAGNVSVAVTPANADGYSVTVAPVFSPGTEIVSAAVDGSPVHFTTRTFSQGIEPSVTQKVSGGSMKFEFTYKPTVEVVPPIIHTKTGDADRGLKIVSVSSTGRELHIEVDGLAGKSYSLGISNPQLVERVEGAKLNSSALEFTLPPTGKDDFVKYNITVGVK
ncbi:MAG TPA: GH116 family glycosyl hydrolase, partial [Candidatus Kryptobacter bacterium]|nr:GH116 family glycosyl hydrolase [Candidatus Kryptobacter bacterium]